MVVNLKHDEVAVVVIRWPSSVTNLPRCTTDPRLHSSSRLPLSLRIPILKGYGLSFRYIGMSLSDRWVLEHYISSMENSTYNTLGYAVQQAPTTDKQAACIF